MQRRKQLVQVAGSEGNSRNALTSPGHRISVPKPLGRKAPTSRYNGFMTLVARLLISTAVTAVLASCGAPTVEDEHSGRAESTIIESTRAIRSITMTDEQRRRVATSPHARSLATGLHHIELLLIAARDARLPESNGTITRLEDTASLCRAARSLLGMSDARSTFNSPGSYVPIAADLRLEASWMYLRELGRSSADVGLANTHLSDEGLAEMRRCIAHLEQALPDLAAMNRRSGGSKLIDEMGGAVTADRCLYVALLVHRGLVARLV